MRNDDRQQHDCSDPTAEDPLVTGGSVRWPDPSPLAKWWQQIVFGDRRAA
ncbi:MULTISPECIES: hypothetical protein [unclassified Rhodococcus (in: high G+C Gram-positive bacteria)]|nr:MULTISPECIES: hypothetical protein [unclassified Rhodococcus (in: high G+C Gram-positive bacteria)]MBC2637781.1 hypothetical protein [Rhodococcus sp. 3A]MBC2897474.1 hypothetical protein [Rhodococcus sp. 4CII]